VVKPLSYQLKYNVQDECYERVKKKVLSIVVWHGTAVLVREIVWRGVGMVVEDQIGYELQEIHPHSA